MCGSFLKLVYISLSISVGVTSPLLLPSPASLLGTLWRNRVVDTKVDDDAGEGSFVVALPVNVAADVGTKHATFSFMELKAGQPSASPPDNIPTFHHHGFTRISELPAIENALQAYRDPQPSWYGPVEVESADRVFAMLRSMWV